MAISHELSGEIAAALLGTKEKTAGEMSDLRETVLQIHSILQQLSDESRSAKTSSGVHSEKHDGTLKARM